MMGFFKRTRRLWRVKIQEYLIQNMQILMRHGSRLPRAMAVLIDGPLTIRRFVKYFSTFLTDRIFNDQKVNFALAVGLYR